MTEPNPQPTPILRVRNLRTYFPVKRGLLRSHVGDVRAVDDVSFDIAPNETLGLVGESGCGKSTVGRTILRLIPATSGSVEFRGEDVFAASRSRMRALRREMQIIFQDPVGSLNPRMTVGNIIGEPMVVHRVCPRDEVPDRVAELLVKVGLQPEHARRYPHAFSGGQRQRIGIARALSLGPSFIVCDEPVSALDVSVQSQVLNLLNDLQDEFGLSYLFIAHNLAVVEHFCDRVAVMYLGRIVELASREALYRNPLHPYTRALLSAAPHPEPRRARRRIMLLGDVPSPVHLFKGGGRRGSEDGRDGEDGRDARPTMGAEERAELEAQREEGVEYVTRHSLLHRPDLVEAEPGHWVSPGAGAGELPGAGALE